MTSDDAMEIEGGDPTSNADGERAADNGNDKPPQPYAALPVYGEHKRAISAVAFAPPPTKHFGSSSINSNAPGLATCASASADGTVKLWQVDTTIGRTDTASMKYSSTPLTARSHLLELEE